MLFLKCPHTPDSEMPHWSPAIMSCSFSCLLPPSKLLKLKMEFSCCLPTLLQVLPLSYTPHCPFHVTCGSNHRYFSKLFPHSLIYYGHSPCHSPFLYHTFYCCHSFSVSLQTPFNAQCWHLFLRGVCSVVCSVVVCKSSANSPHPSMPLGCKFCVKSNKWFAWTWYFLD